MQSNQQLQLDKDLQHLAAIVRDSDDAILGKTLEGIITSWNGGAERIYGYTAEEAIGRTVAMLVPPDREDELPEILRRLTQGEGINHYDTLRVTKDGRLVNISLTVSPIRDASGAITGVSSIGRDVTKEKEAEAALREAEEALVQSEKRLVEAQELAHMGSWEWDLVSNEATGSAEMLRLLGLQPLGGENRFTIQSFIECLQPEDREWVQQALAKAVEERGSINYENRIISPDGTVRIIHGLGEVILDDAGQPVKMIGTARDITESNRAEEALRESEERHRAILEQVSEAIFLIEPDTMRFVVTNPAFQRLVGYTADELLDMTIYDVLPYERERIDLAVLRALDEGEYRVSDRLYRRKDGSLVDVEVGITPVIYSGRKVLCQIVRDITERKQAEEALTRSEAELRALFEAMTDVVLVLDAQGRYLQIAPTSPDLLYKPPAELLGRTIHEVLPTADADNLLHTIRLALEKRQPVHVEYSLPIGDGEVWFDGTVSPMGEDKVFWIARDVTERKRADEALHASEDRYRTLVEQAADGIFTAKQTADHKLTVEDVNSTACEMFGYTREELVGRDVTELVVADDSPTALAKSAAFFAGKVLRSERLLIRKDGTTLAVETNTKMLDDGRMQSIARDITDRKRAEEALRESEERYRLITETATDVIIVIDEESNILFANRAVEDTFGYSVAQIIGQPLTMLMPESMRQHHRAGIARYMKTGHKQMAWGAVELPGLHKSGKEVPLEISFAESSKNGKRIFTGTMRDITERKRAEESLRLSSEILQRVKSLVLVSDKDGQITYASPSIKTVLGYEPQEMLGDGWWHHSSIDPEDGKRERSHIVQLTAPESIVPGEPYERMIKSKTGELHCILWQDVKGPGDQLIGVGHDITERKESEESLRESEERFRLMFANNPLPMWVYDLESLRFLEVNEAAVVHYGYSRDEFLSMCITNIRPSEEIPRLMENLAQVRPSLQSSDEWRHQKKDGQIIDVQITSHTFTFQFDGSSAILVVAEDITEQKRVEEVLTKAKDDLKLRVAEQTSELQTIFEAFPDLYFRIRSDGTILDYKAGSSGDLYAPPEAFMGKRVQDVLPPDVARQSQEAMRQVATTGSLVGIEYSLPMPDGEKAFEARFLPVLEEQIMIFIRDITERKQSEESLRKAKAEADQANQAKSEFLSRMSHELRTPLNAILGFGQLLDMGMSEAGGSPAERQHIGYVLQAGRHLLNLINDILDITRIDAGRLPLSPEPVPISEVIEECTTLVRPLAAQRNVELQTVLERAWYVSADRQRLKQVLLNLLANAIKYNHDGGRVTLSCEELPDNHLRICVSDTGSGIPAEQLGKLFMPFERLGADQTGVEGTGLGLALSKRLIEAIGGTIGVSSTVGQGSTFWVSLPAVEGPVEQMKRTGTGPLSQTLLPKQARTLLYIEDNFSNLQLIEGILEYSPDISILAAMQGQLGLDLAREHQPDLILLDLHLPDMTGNEVLRQLRQDPGTRSIPVVVISADATPGQIDRLLAAGSQRYLTKPLDVREFLTVLKEILYQGDI